MVNTDSFLSVDESTTANQLQLGNLLAASRSCANSRVTSRAHSRVVSRAESRRGSRHSSRASSR